jgi:predicted anti-sigma-YlaC factor YlaD
MTECKDVRNRLDLLFDRETDALTRAEIQRHVSGCKACRAETERLRNTERLLKGFPRVKCPDTINRAIARAVVKRGPQWNRFRPSWRTVLIAAVLILFLFGVRPLGKNGSPEPAYSETEIRKAREEAKWSLTYVGQVLNRTNRRVVADAILNQLPESLRKGITSAIPGIQGGKKP